jgi:hypothetical protein
VRVPYGQLSDPMNWGQGTLLSLLYQVQDNRDKHDVRQPSQKRQYIKFPHKVFHAHSTNRQRKPNTQYYYGYAYYTENEQHYIQKSHDE